MRNFDKRQVDILDRAFYYNEDEEPSRNQRLIILRAMDEVYSLAIDDAIHKANEYLGLIATYDLENLKIQDINNI